MTQEPKLPNLETVKQTSAKMKEICNRADAEILVLDSLIAQLDEQIHSSPLYRYRLKRTKDGEGTSSLN
ncbi:hypothetical protein [Floridanema evergladense]|uniref:Uncharacterized protein n=1 Tax=Floridaenema evergladense BLCC-F167 TaxID=3153639 RepID=A0ABV4WW12_9CYAN